MAVQYLRTYAICSPVTTIIFAMDNYLRISGKIKGSMLLNILMSVLHRGPGIPLSLRVPLGNLGGGAGLGPGHGDLCDHRLYPLCAGKDAAPG